MTLLQDFQRYISNHQLFDKNQKLLLAISGGVDSVVLCNLCYELGLKFAIAHCNFNLRGEESIRDEEFVRQIGLKYNITTYLKHFDTKTFAEDNKLSIQVAARELRYNWFQEILNGIEQQNNQHNSLTIPENVTYSYILTAHHLDDNIETILMNFFKGTGIAGLRGIKPKYGRIVRPLLFASKENIIQYAKNNQLSWVEDSSNEENKYTRNLFRNELIPIIQNVFPAVKSNLSDNIIRFHEIEMLYHQAIHNHKKKLVELKDNEVHIPVLKIKKVQPLPSVIYEIIKEYGFEYSQVKECIKLLESESGKYILSSTHRILRNRAWIIISPLQTDEQNIYLIESLQSIINLKGKKLSFKLLKYDHVELKQSPDLAVIDASELKFPLMLRKWKQGDYFYPLGMRKKKKLSRFFIDKKLSLLEKENTWVLESDRRIVWVVGQRIDDRFKISNTTKELVQINWSNL